MSGTDAPLTFLACRGPGEARLLASLGRHNVTGLPVVRADVGADPRERAALLLTLAADSATPALLPLPSDAVLVRDAVAEDFVGPQGLAGLTEDRDRRAAGRVRDVGPALEHLGVPAPRPLLLPGGPMALLREEVRALLSGHGPADRLAQILPDALVWQALWLQSRGDLAWREPTFLRLGSAGVPAAYSLRGITEADVARGFVGYTGSLPAPDPDGVEALARHLSPTVLLRAAAAGAYARAPRVQRFVRRATGGRGPG